MLLFSLLTTSKFRVLGSLGRRSSPWENARLPLFEANCNDLELKGLNPTQEREYGDISGYGTRILAVVTIDCKLAIN